MQKTCINNDIQKERKYVQKEGEELQQWVSEEHRCEHCNKIMTEYYGSGRFCCKSCANSRQQSEETRQKISASGKEFYETGIYSSPSTYVPHPKTRIEIKKSSTQKKEEFLSQEIQIKLKEKKLNRKSIINDMWKIHLYARYVEKLFHLKNHTEKHAQMSVFISVYRYMGKLQQRKMVEV